MGKTPDSPKFSPAAVFRHTVIIIIIIISISIIVLLVLLVLVLL